MFSSSTYIPWKPKSKMDVAEWRWASFGKKKIKFISPFLYQKVLWVHPLKMQRPLNRWETHCLTSYKARSPAALLPESTPAGPSEPPAPASRQILSCSVLTRYRLAIRINRWVHSEVKIHRAWVHAYAAAAAKSLQSCLTLCDPIDGSPPGLYAKLL